MGLIYAADGSAIKNTERPEMHWDLGFMRMLAIFARNCEESGLGIVCMRCFNAKDLPKREALLAGANAREDNFWRMDCACRSYIGRNPLSTAQKNGQ